MIMAKGKKTGGRKPGTPNKISKDIRILLKNILYSELENLPSYLDKLEPKDRALVIIKLTQIAIPALDSVNYQFDELPDDYESPKKYTNPSTKYFY